MIIKTLIFHFICEEHFNGTADKLRGFFANKFNEDVHFHHHINDELSYAYPLIQYKILQGEPVVIGIKEGADILQKIHNEVSLIKIGTKNYQIKDTKIVLQSYNFGITESLPYSFLTPWLALNESNYKKYIKFGDDEKKRSFLKKILIGNLLSISKSLGYTVPEPIIVNITKLKEVNTVLKRNPMLGFLGDFSVNFEIPDYWGIGKSVSRGFGTVIRKI